MQHKISTAILAIILATTMMTSSTLSLTRAFAQDPFTEFFQDLTGGQGNQSEETATENGTVPSEVGNDTGNVTEGGAVTPGPAVCPEPPVVPPVVVLPPEDNATSENVTTGGPVPFPPQNETEVPPIVTEPPVEETPAENVTEVVPPVEEVPAVDNETMAVDENVTVVEPPIVVVPDGNTTTGENGTVVLPPEVPVITPGENSTEEVIEAIENQTEAVENQTEIAENVTGTGEEATVVETIQIELTKEIGAGFLTLLQVGQFIPSVTEEEVESLQVAAESLQTALASAIDASGSITIDQSNVGSGDQSNTATVNQGLYGDSTAAFYDAGHRRAR